MVMASSADDETHPAGEEHTRQRHDERLHLEVMDDRPHEAPRATPKSSTIGTTTTRAQAVCFEQIGRKPPS